MSNSVSIEQLDRNFAPVETTADTVWYDIRDLGIEGRGWSDVESFYDRLPARAKDVVRPDVWKLSQHSAGLFARFVASSPRISARWTLRTRNFAMAHMPATGVSGVDLYGRCDGVFRHAGNGRPAADLTNSVVLIDNMTPVTRDYILYLPLYNGVESVQIGLPPQGTLAKAPPRAPGHDKPIVFYGTSVTQGGCASRPGMAFPAILSRWLDTPVINLGFSGNGRMELEVVRFITEIDARIFVIDCTANMELSQVQERTEPTVRMLREAHPRTPIVLVGNVPYTNRVFCPSSAQGMDRKNAALAAAFHRLLATGVTNLHHVPALDLYGDDGEATVDGCHATDLGFLRAAETLAPILRNLI